MPIYDQCNVNIDAPQCDPCLTDIEHGRVRAVAIFVSKSAYDAVVAAPDQATAWQTGITAGEIFIIPDTSGTFDGGAPQDGPGYGDLASRNIGFQFTLLFNDPNFKTNCAFYNQLARNNGVYIGWKTETQVRLSGAPVRIVPTSPVTDDVTSELVFAVNAIWNERDQPCPFDAPEGIFVCQGSDDGDDD